MRGLYGGTLYKMTISRLTTKPTLEDIKSGLIRSPESIHVQSGLMRGQQQKLGILVLSDWHVDYQEKQVRFQSGYIVVQTEKIPIPAMDIPDRHLRAVRRIAAAVFNVKRFYGLRLYDRPVDDIIFHIQWKNPRVETINREEHVFLISREDAVLWCQLNPESNATPEDIEPMRIERVRSRFFPSETRHAIIRRAQKACAALETELLRLLLQASTGSGAIERLKTLKSRGIDLGTLEHIWQKYKQQELPETVRGKIESQR